MRNLFILAFGFLFVGCGVIREIASDTCGHGNYNVAVCKNPLDRMVPKAPAVKTSDLGEVIKCQVKVKTWRKGGMTLQESVKTCRPK